MSKMPIENPDDHPGVVTATLVTHLRVLHGSGLLTRDARGAAVVAMADAADMLERLDARLLKIESLAHER